MHLPPSSTGSTEERVPRITQVEGREWWLWGFAVVVTLVLTGGIVFLTVPGFHLPSEESFPLNIKDWARGLAGLVLLFDIYTLYQHLQLQRMRRRLAERDRLFQLISENAADMIALIDNQGNRLYNSPAYSKILGYSREELSATSALEQIHPEDRDRVLEAAANAQRTGKGEQLEYRIRHKNGSWRVLESTASPIRGVRGKIEGLVVVNRDITERKRTQELLVHNALHDALTNLPNRMLFLDRLARSIAMSKRHPHFKFAVFLVDIDGFRVLNDSLGHAAGDTMLIEVGKRLSTCLRRVDTVSRAQSADNDESEFTDCTVARPGGDEFAVLTEELHDPSDAIRVAERIQARLAIPFQIEGHEIVITSSIGVVFGGNGSTTAEEVLRDAEIAMHRAKQTGKARCEVFDNAMHAGALKRLQLETDMRKGLDEGEFCVYYQPIVELRNCQVVGFEALGRWHRPDGLVMPNDFIPVAEETGIILAINRQLLLTACRQVFSWQKLFPHCSPLTLSFNITARQFSQANLASEIGTVIRQTGLAPQHLSLEITETIAMSDVEKSAVMLLQLKALGVRLDIDDFGTGYSSLSRLQQFPVDTLKIDRVFVSRMDEDEETQEIVRIIIALAHNLGMRVVAEGVEKEAQRYLLSRLGCEYAQGYLFAKPADDETTKRLLQATAGGPIGGRRFTSAASSST
jgi:PAS domain S-box-containing protein